MIRCDRWRRARTGGPSDRGALSLNFPTVILMLYGIICAFSIPAASEADIKIAGSFHPFDRFPLIDRAQTDVAFVQKPLRFIAASASGGEATWICTSDASDSHFINCQDLVPSNWASGSAVFLATDGSSSRVLVGFVVSCAASDIGPESLALSKRDISSRNAHAEFIAWVESSPRASDLPIGVDLAQLRLQGLRSLAEVDPDAASQLRLPYYIRQTLAPEILPFIEEPIDDVVTFAHSIAEDFISRVEEANHIVLPNGQYYQLPQNDLRFAPFMTDEIPVWGFVLDKKIAVLSSNAARSADPGEFPQIHTPTGSKLLVAARTAIIVPDTTDIVQFSKDLRRESGAIAGAFGTSRLSKRATQIIGNGAAINSVKKVLFANVLFGLTPMYRYTTAEVREMLRRTEMFVTNGTNGLISRFDSQVYDCTVSDIGMYSFSSLDTVQVDCSNNLLLMGITSNTFDHFVMVWPEGYQLSWMNWLGMATTSGSGWSWMAVRSNITSVFAHEFGHHFGMRHSPEIKVSSGRSFGPFTFSEYSSAACWMGNRHTKNEVVDFANRWAIGQKDRIKLLSSIVPVKEPSLYRLYAHDLPRALDASTPQGLRIGKARIAYDDVDKNNFAEFTYYLEYRMRTDGVFGGVTMTANRLESANVADTFAPYQWTNYLLYANPLTTAFGSNGDTGSASLSPGVTYVDATMPLIITHMGIYQDGSVGVPYSLLDIRYTLYPDNQPPAISISGPTTCAQYDSVTYTVTASDPDGDDLNYVWYRDNARADLTINSTQMTFAMSKVGVQVIFVVVFDRRGASAAASVRVAVGSSSAIIASKRVGVSGRVVDSLTGAGVPGVHVWAGQYYVNLEFKAEGMTNATGYFDIAGMPPSWVNLNVQLLSSECVSYSGNVLTTSSTNIFNEGLIITCVRPPKVSIQAIDLALFNGSTTSLNLTRYGGNLAQTLAVSISCIQGKSAAYVNNVVLPSTATSIAVTFAANQQSVLVPVLHQRPTTSDPRNMTVSCRVNDESGYMPAYPAIASISLIGTLAGPVNDYWSNATVVEGASATLPGYLGAASVEINEPYSTRPIYTSPSIVSEYACRSVWYKWTAWINGTLTLSMTGASMEVYVGSSIEKLMMITPIYKRVLPFVLPVDETVQYSIKVFDCGATTAWTETTLPYTLTLSFAAPPPVEPPVAAPVQAPVTAPVDPPVEPPVEAPVDVPAAAPVDPPAEAPVQVPATAPVDPPVEAPVLAPVQVPVESPVNAPVEAPRAAPASAPVAAPVSSPQAPPTAAPITSPVAVPIFPPHTAPASMPAAVPAAPFAPVATPSAVPQPAPTAAPVSSVATPTELTGVDTGSTSAGTVAGIVIAIFLVALIAAAILAWVLMRRRASNNKEAVAMSAAKPQSSPTVASAIVPDTKPASGPQDASSADGSGDSEEEDSDEDESEDSDASSDENDESATSSS